MPFFPGAKLAPSLSMPAPMSPPFLAATEASPSMRPAASATPSSRAISSNVFRLMPGNPPDSSAYASISTFTWA